MCVCVCVFGSDRQRAAPKGGAKKGAARLQSSVAGNVLVLPLQGRSLLRVPDTQIEIGLVYQAHDLVHKHRDAILGRLVERNAQDMDDRRDAALHSQGSLPPHSTPSKPDVILDRIRRRAERYISRRRK